MFQKSEKWWLVPAVLLPLLAAGCGGTGDTTNGLFGGTGTNTLGGTASSSTPAPSVTPSVATGSLQPNAAPLAAQSGATPATGQAQAAATVTNGPLAPLSGTYAGTWTAAVTAPTPAPGGTTSETPAPPAATPAKSVPARSGAFTLKISYPTHPSKTVLGDVSGTWTDPALGGTGKLSGTIDRIGLPNEPNAVHVIGKIRFPGGKDTPLVVELSEDAVGHLAGATTDDTISLKKSH